MSTAVSLPSNAQVTTSTFEPSLSTTPAASEPPLSTTPAASVAAASDSRLPRVVAHLATLPDLLTYGQKGASLTLLGYAGAHYVADIWERSHHTALLLEKVFHPDHLNEMARRTGFVQRQRHFYVPCYVAAWWVIPFDHVSGYYKRRKVCLDALV